MPSGRFVLRVSIALAALSVGAAAQTPPAPPPAAPPAPAAPAPAAPAPAPAPGATSAPAPGEAPAAEKKPAASGGGGYTWTDKPRRKGAKKRAKKRAPKLKLDPKAPLATYPGFRMLKEGKSSVWVSVSRKVNVNVRRAAGRFTYVLTGAQVGTWNNTHPLVTHYFATPLARAWLRPDAGGAELVLELRENVEPKHRVVDGPGGTMTLEVELPRPKRSHGVAESAPIDAKKGQIALPPASRRGPSKGP